MTAMSDSGKKNRFFAEDYFFIVDSDRLDEVSTKLYGFGIQNDGLVEDEELQNGASFTPDGHGVYVYLQREQNNIRIYQDYNGCYGIYIFKKDERFVISNSFMRLVEYVKLRFEITVNEDYARHFVAAGLCSLAYSDTMVNEIEILGKNAVVNINCDTKELSVDYIDYKENTVEIDSEEGMKILDRWYSRWTSLMRSIHKETQNMNIPLSGGFDSRLTFMLLLKSGIDLSSVQVFSINDKLHTHAEDFEIASQIADHFKFKLNNGKLTTDGMNYTVEDCVNLSFYTKLAFHKQMYYKPVKFTKRRFYFPGSGGECVRGYWRMPKEEFVKEQLKYANPFSGVTADEIRASLKKILNDSFDRIAEKYHIEDPDSEEFASNLYRETRGRHHYGKAMVEDYMGNTITCAPLMDPDLNMLKLNNKHCEDKTLLIAVIYARFCRKLLDFKFDSGRVIEPETIKCAEEISAKYPFTEDKSFSFERKFRLEMTETPDNSQVDRITDQMISKYIKNLFASKKMRYIFDSFIDDQVYRMAMDHMKNVKFHPLQKCYTIIGVAKILDDVYTSRGVRSNSLQDFMDNYIGDSGAFVDEFDPYEHIKRLSNYITARFDVKITDNEAADFELLYLSDARAKIQKPAWLQKNGMGYVIESDNFSLNMSLKCISDGKLQIALKGKDVRDAEKNRIERWIDFTRFQVNDKVIFDERKPVWHNEPFSCAYEVHAGEVVYIHAEWDIHDTSSPVRVLTQAEKEAEKEEKTIKEKLNALEKKIDIIKNGIEEIKEQSHEEKSSKKRLFK